MSKIYWLQSPLNRLWHSKNKQTLSLPCFLSDCSETLHPPPLAWQASEHIQIFIVGCLISSELIRKHKKISPFGNFWTWKTSPWQQGILLQASKINMVGKTLYHWVPFGKFKRNLVFTIDMALIRSWKNSKNFWFDQFSKSSVF